MSLLLDSVGSQAQGTDFTFDEFLQGEEIVREDFGEDGKETCVVFFQFDCSKRDVSKQDSNVRWEFTLICPTFCSGFRED